MKPETLTTTTTPLPPPKYEPTEYPIHGSTLRSRHRRRKSRSLLTRFQSLSRRTKLLLTAVFLLLLALLLGLSIGMSLRHHGASDLPLPTPNGSNGPYTGDLTYYGPGLGACGLTSTDTDHIVSISHSLFDAAQVGTNPNTNPLCGRKIRAQRQLGPGGDDDLGTGQQVSVDLKVVDRCVGCQPDDLDTTDTVFQTLTGDTALGRVHVRWSWLDDGD